MKKNTLLVSMIAPMILLTACGAKENQSTASSVSETKTETSTTKVETPKQKSTDSSDIEADLKKTTKAETVTELYKNTDVHNFEDKGVSETVNGYTFYQIENFSRDLDYNFDKQHEKGGVVVLNITLKNKTDKSVYVGGSPSMSVTGYSRDLSTSKEVISNNLYSDLYRDKGLGELKAGEELSGYASILVTPEAMEKIAQNGHATLSLTSITGIQDSFKKEDLLLDNQKITLPLDAAGEKNVEAAAKFYPDKATVDNLGTKTMIEEKEINQTQEFEGYNVTFDGYQITEFVPNEDQAPRFSKLDTGIILLTTKLSIKNNGKETLEIDNTGGTLEFGDKGKYLNENSFDVKLQESTLAPGQEATKYVVFLLDKETYEKLLHDKDKHLEVKLQNESFQSLTKIGDLQFDF